ncbi:hypothetical protein Vadar_033352 [Vaccinium darrowii]|uniref:Uncharacterized protein n=1 Tax=Vaccinium darrowii TaxID=229202 RepID=A0ACB7X676_9ERIC|nr:hypothetical protein Vadar_033352 [Vaccinium darrowii]
MELILLPSPVTVIPAILIFLLFLYYLRRKNTVTNKKFPPEAGGAWPLIGHVHLLAGRKVPGKVLGALADKHGPIFTVRLGVCPALVVSKSEIVKECFSALNDKAFSDRPKFIAIELLSYNYADLSVSPHGPYWRKMRKIVMLKLLSNRRLAVFSHVRELEVKISVKEVYEKWMKEGRCLVEMKRWFEDITLKITLQTIAGNGKPDVKGYGEAFKDFFKLIAGFTIGDAIPFLRWLDLGGYEKEAKRTGKKIDEMFQGWLNEHKRRKNSGESAKAEKDFMDVMLEILDGGTKEELNFDADTIIKATCQGLTVGGIASTATTLTWAIALLLNNPHALKKAQEELDTQIGGQRQVKESDIKYLVYIQAIIKETMRLYPPTHLVPSAPHEDPEAWPNPWEFWPERFLTTHKDFDFMGKHFEFLPFGGGKRGCPGISFALQVMQLTLASLLHAFEIATPANELVDMTGGFGFSNSKMMPLEVLLTPRLPFEVYGG